GLKATRDTLKRPDYSGIVADLKAGTFSAADILHRNVTEFGTWGTAVGCLAARLHTITGPAPYRNNTPSILPQPGGLTGTTVAPLPLNVLKAWGKLSHALSTTLPTQMHRARAVAGIIRTVGYTGPSGR